jgi:uncharacterized membrane protein YebE (DUF533 family)
MAINAMMGGNKQNNQPGTGGLGSLASSLLGGGSSQQGMGQGSSGGLGAQLGNLLGGHNKPYRQGQGQGQQQMTGANGQYYGAGGVQTNQHPGGSLSDIFQHVTVRTHHV